MMPLFPQSAEQSVKFKRVNQDLRWFSSNYASANGVIGVNVPQWDDVVWSYRAFVNHTEHAAAACPSRFTKLQRPHG
jgi:hypothetical protein